MRTHPHTHTSTPHARACAQGTPIGNLEDTSLRALRILRCASLILAEDTRHTRRLLSHFGIRTPTLSCHEHNERQRQELVLRRLQQGEVRGGVAVVVCRGSVLGVWRVHMRREQFTAARTRSPCSTLHLWMRVSAHTQPIALVSDAGMPGISDPGAITIAAAVAAGVRVVPVPGPCAAIAALAGGGLPTAAFHFAGFLPPKSGKRRAALTQVRAGVFGARLRGGGSMHGRGSQQCTCHVCAHSSHKRTPCAGVAPCTPPPSQLQHLPATLVFYAPPHGLAATLGDMVAVLGPQRQAVVARELTKVHEEFFRCARVSVCACNTHAGVASTRVCAATSQGHSAGGACGVWARRQAARAGRGGAAGAGRHSRPAAAAAGGGQLSGSTRRRRSSRGAGSGRSSGGTAGPSA